MNPDDEEARRFATKMRWWTVAAVFGAMFWILIIQQVCRLIVR